MTVVFTNGRALSAWEMSRLAGGLDGTYMFPSIAGGVVTASSGLTVAISAITGNVVTINGTLVATTYAGGTATATAADATNPRRDLVYYDTSGAVGILAGTPAALTATTGPVTPTPSATQIAIAELYVANGVTVINAGDISDRRQQVIGSKRSSGTGTFIIPAGPAVGTSVTTSASANTYGSWTELLAATSAAIHITHLSINMTSGTESYSQVNLGTGAGGAEVSIGEYKFESSDGISDAFTIPIPWISVAAGTRIAARVAGSEAFARPFTVSLICINQSNVVTF